MSAIVTADIHLNDKPADAYRWGLLTWLTKQDADELIVCGDLTDAKDRHGAALVNRFFEAAAELKCCFRTVVFLKGNHDYLDPCHPFFRFLGGQKGVRFMTEPAELDLSVGRSLFVPAGSKWDFNLPHSDYDYVFAHATFNGAVAENGQTLTGVDPAVVRGFKGKVWSGDIHTQQKLAGGAIEYIGAPYHVKFGDGFEPRVVRIADSGKVMDLYYPAPRKRMVTIAEPAHLRDEQVDRGDHVRVKCVLQRAQYNLWPRYQQEIRKIAADRGWVLFRVEPVALDKVLVKTGVSGSDLVAPEDAVLEYARQQKASKAYAEAGVGILRAAGSAADGRKNNEGE